MAASDYNPYNPNKSTETSGDFNLAWGTNDRMQLCLCKINFFKEVKDFGNNLEQLKILFDEICTFVSDINKDGQFIKKPEFQTAEQLEKYCDDEIKSKCIINQRNGKTVFIATIQLINYLREYERYLRALMFKYKIYTKTKDNTLAAARVG